MTKEGFHEEIELPEGVDANIKDSTLNLKGPKGEVTKKMHNPLVKISLKDKKIILSSDKTTKKNKKMLGTLRAHLKNMIKGATEGHIYKLKICSSHFPMTANMENGSIVIKNFLGEKSPRKLKIKEGVEAKVNGSEITITSCNKEKAGQAAADIEELTKISNKDKRIFQDGVYIIEKDGKKI